MLPLLDTGYFGVWHIYVLSTIVLSLTINIIQMITKNFEDYPEHRLKFFSLLRAIAAHCFPALVHLSSEVCILHQSYWHFVDKVLFYMSEIQLKIINYLLASYFYTIILFTLVFLLLCSAIKTCSRFYHLGFPAHWTKYSRDWSQPIIGNADKFSGVVWFIKFLWCW